MLMFRDAPSIQPGQTIWLDSKKLSGSGSGQIFEEGISQIPARIASINKR